RLHGGGARHPGAGERHRDGRVRARDRHRGREPTRHRRAAEAAREGDLMYADRARLARLHAAEVERFRVERPESGRLSEAARRHLPEGVPMLWMAKWPGPWPVHVVEASGAHFVDADGIDHVDLCLGDTGAMVGHAPAASVAALTAQLARGSTFMLPTADA